VGIAKEPARSSKASQRKTQGLFKNRHQPKALILWWRNLWKCLLSRF